VGGGEESGRRGEERGGMEEARRGIESCAPPLLKFLDPPLNRSRVSTVSCAPNTLMLSIGLNITP